MWDLSTLRPNHCSIFQPGLEESALNSVASNENDVPVDFLEEVDDVGKNPPVLAAVIAAISWLFFCAGLFMIWEDWSYWISFYFFFISWSTIGKFLTTD